MGNVLTLEVVEKRQVKHKCFKSNETRYLFNCSTASQLDFQFTLYTSFLDLYSP